MIRTKEMRKFICLLLAIWCSTCIAQQASQKIISTTLATNGPQADVWMNVQISQASGTLKEYYPYGTLKPKFYIVYPDGDYYPYFPVEGLLAFSNTNKNESWGIFTMKGSKGKFKSKYEDMQVEKISSTEMRKVGYAFGFYKCVPVDGLLLNGQWGTIPGWEEDPNRGNASGYNGTGVRPVIEFKKDSSFTDYGAFVTNMSMPRQYPDRAPGKGTYRIENFTLVLKYDDGRIIHKAFTGAGNKNPATFSKLIYIGVNPFYSKSGNR